MKRPKLFFLFLFSFLVVNSVFGAVYNDLVIYGSNISYTAHSLPSGGASPVLIADDTFTNQVHGYFDENTAYKVVEHNFTLQNDYYLIFDTILMSGRCTIHHSGCGSINDYGAPNYSTSYCCLDEVCTEIGSFSNNIDGSGVFTSGTTNEIYFYENVTGEYLCDKIKFQTVGNKVGVTDLWINEIYANFSSISTESNKIPLFNLSYNDTVIYMNNSLGYAIFPFLIDAYDPEGDQILYAINTNYQQKVLSFYSFDEAIYRDEGETYDKYSNYLYVLNCLILDRSQFWGLCSDDIIFGTVADTSPIDNDYITSNNCDISNSVIDGNNLIKDVQWHINAQRGYYLFVNRSCDSPIHIFPRDGIIDNFGLDIYLEPNNNSIIEYRTYRSLMDPSDIPFYINKTHSSGNLTVNYNDTLLFSSVYPSIRISLTSLFNESKAILRIYNENYTLLYTDNDFFLSANAYLYTDLTNIQGNFSFDDMLYFETLYTGNWSSTYEHPLRIYQEGYTDLIFYVTDEFHQDIFTNKQELTIQVLPQSMKTESLQEQDIFKAFFWFRDWLDLWGATTYFYNSMWIVELIVAFTLIIIDRERFLVGLLVTSATFCVFGLLGLSSVGQLLTNIALVALALTPSVAKIWGDH